jgi:hypothetical protein
MIVCVVQAAYAALADKAKTAAMMYFFILIPLVCLVGQSQNA